VMDRGKELGIPVPALEGFQQAMETAMGGSVENAASAMENFVSRNEAPRTAQPSQPISRNNVPSDKPSLEGFLMSVTHRSQSARTQAPAGALTSGRWDSLYVAVPILSLLFLWRTRRNTSKQIV
jgi:hypothetical protein